MKNERGFIEWLLVAKIALAIMVAVGSAILGYDYYPQMTAPATARLPVHEGTVQSIEYGSFYQFDKIIMFSDGAKYAMRPDCVTQVGAHLRITSDETGMHCE